MQGTRGRLYFYGSLEAAARFGDASLESKPALRAIPNPQPLESLERLADPQSPGGKPICKDLVLWGRCGFVPSENVEARDAK